MNQLDTSKRVFLVGGSGGVGKTTLAAALAVRLAEKGFKTVVLTVDPAKRLAQALGLTSFNGELQKVEIPNVPSAVLFASMLDAERDFDRVISRFAKTQVQREKILNSRLYRMMVESLGGSHEYAAMERLLEFAEDSQFDKVVVDTPPSQNAMDLLKAPERLADFMDTSVLKWFQGKSPKYFDIFKQGTRLAMKALQTVFGGEFLKELGQVLEDLEGMQAGFRERNLEVIRLLRSKETGFLLVTTPSEIRFLESKQFIQDLNQIEIPISGLLLNRIEPTVEEPSHSSDPNLKKILSYYSELHQNQEKYLKKMESLLPDSPHIYIAKQHSPIHAVSALSNLGHFLVS